MNESLAKFLDQAQLHAVLAFISGIARAGLAAESERLDHGWLKKLSILVGSVALGVSLGYLCEMHESVRKWAPLAALAAGFLAQHIAMRITRRADALLDAAENHLPIPHNDHEHDKTTNRPQRSSDRRSTGRR